jgi:hypothetical protein
MKGEIQFTLPPTFYGLAVSTGQPRASRAAGRTIRKNEIGGTRVH